MFDGNQVDDPVYGSVLEVAYQALEKTGGKVSVVLGSLPSYGPGAVALRDARTGFTGEHEKTCLLLITNFTRTLVRNMHRLALGWICFVSPRSFGGFQYWLCQSNVWWP